MAYPIINPSTTDADTLDGYHASSFQLAANPTIVRAYLNSAQNNLTNSTNVLVNLDAEDFDVGSDFNTTTHLFTVPVTGYYRIEGQIGFSSVADGTRYIASIRTSGPTDKVVSAGHASSTGAIYVKVGSILYLSAADTVGLYAQPLKGDDTVDLVQGSTLTYMSIELVSV